MAVSLVPDDVGGIDSALADVPAGYVPGDEPGIRGTVVTGHVERQTTVGRLGISVVAVVDDIVSVGLERRDDAPDFAQWKRGKNR